MSQETPSDSPTRGEVVSEESLDLVGEVMDIDCHMVDTSSLQCIDGALEESLLPYPNKSFRHCVGERLEACAKTSGEDECVRAFLFAMAEFHLHLRIFLSDAVGKMLSGIDGAMLSACATEREHQGSEASLEITLNMEIG